MTPAPQAPAPQAHDETRPARLRVVFVTGLSGGGKLSVLGALEDLGFETVDNPPLEMLADMVSHSERELAVGVDARTRGFDATRVLETLAALRANPRLRPELVYVTADEPTLLRRYTESRRPHPLAPHDRVAIGIAHEQTLIGKLREAADLVVDTSHLPIGAMRRRIEQRFGAATATDRLVVTLVSFAYRQGLPPEADLVFDARFLRNPHYDPLLGPRTGLDPEVGAFIAADPDFAAFLGRMAELVEMLLPRFVQEGKKYATIAIGCTGGRHRSVYLIEKLAARLTARLDALRAAGATGGWQLQVMHRELARDGGVIATPSGATQGGATPSGTTQGGAPQDRATGTNHAALRRTDAATDDDVPDCDVAHGGVVNGDGATDDSLGAWPLPAQAQEA
jgi:RNase adapter protein RapZ